MVNVWEPSQKFFKIHFMIKVFLTNSIFLISCILNAQSFSKIDSLKNMLNKEKTDTNKCNILNTITSICLYTTPPAYKLALAYAEKAKVLSEKISFKKGAANAYLSLSTIYGYFGIYDKAFESCLKEINIWEQLYPLHEPHHFLLNNSA